MEVLVKWVLEYEEARRKCDECPEMILSSGNCDEAFALMNDMDQKRERMFQMAHILDRLNKLYPDNMVK